MAVTEPELILFAKQPVPGQVKTRLHAGFSPQAAARIAAWLIEATTRLAADSWPGNIYLYTLPDPDFPLFRRLAKEYPVHLGQQAADGDLGERMSMALREGVQRSGAAAVMGCDVPHCPPAVIGQAYASLTRGRNVIGPSEDGGYYLIGLQQACTDLFRNINWGSDEVLAATLSRAGKLGLDFDVLPVLRDLDTVEDLMHISKDFPPLREFVEDAWPGT